MLTLIGRLYFELQVLRSFLVLHDWHYARVITGLGMNPSGLSVTEDGLRVDALDVSIPRDSAWLIPLIELALLLQRTLGVRFCISPGGIIADTGRFKLRIATRQGMEVLREVLEGVYNFGVAPTDTVVWDIGMNAGTASLYFAARSNVRAVVGFEPFRPTFEAAKSNLAMNPELEPKIKPHNFGIAARSYGMETEFDSLWNASASLCGSMTSLRDRLRLSGTNVTIEHVELLAADRVLMSIVADYPHCAIVAKIDCEGSEYEIIHCLHEKRLLRKLSIVMLEWHKRGPEELQAILHDAGFCTYSASPSNGVTGMLYAVNTTCRANQTPS